MGVDCYCNLRSEQGNIPVPPLDKPVDPSNNIKNNDEFNRQETYNRVITIVKNDIKTSNKKDKESNSNNNNNLILEKKENDNDNNNDNNNIEQNSDFDKKINSCSTQITEEEFNSKINKKILDIELKFGKIDQNKKDEYTKNIDEKIIFKSPLLFKETNFAYFGSWDSLNIKKEGWGILIDKDGNKYEGSWKKDIMDGYGRIISINGNYYEGEIKNGIIEGNGTYYSNDKQFTYKGEFKNNLFEGKGEQIFENSENNKSIYEGMFKSGKKEGKGKYTFENGNSYEGEFKNDKYNGDGCFKWNDGREYKGKWKDNQINGKGIFKWDKNEWFEGEYKDNRREGFGVYHFGVENNYYEGKWLNNLPHGEGKLVKDGKTEEGRFRFGKLIQNGKGKKINGNIKEVKYKNENVNGKIINKKKNSFK